MLVAFFGTFRIGELLDRVLLVSGIVLFSGTAYLAVCCSNTDQKGSGQGVTLHSSSDMQLCSVWALDEWLPLVGARSGSSFEHEGGLPLM